MCKCIQAGTIRLQIRPQDARKSREAIVGLQQLASMDKGCLYLVEICPTRLTPNGFQKENTA